MKALFDFIPLLLFLIVYRMEPQTVELAGQAFVLGGVASSTVVLIVMSLLVYGGLGWRQRHLDLGQWAALLLSLLFGGLTLAFHNESFLKWKAPVIHWVFAAFFIGSLYVGDRRPLLQRLMGALVARHGELSQRLWRRLNAAWILYFVLGGLLQLYVAFNLQSIWVEFKIFGAPAMSFALLAAQALFVYHHLRQQRLPPSS